MKKALSDEGIVKYWSDIVKTHAEKGVDREVRQSAMHLMVELWTQMSEAVEKIKDLPNTLLTLLKKGARDSNLAVQVTALTCLFTLLDYFASSSESFAPYVYKTLIFSLIENHSNEVVRDFIMINMGNALENMDQVPVGVMVEPVVKQVALKGYSNQDFPTFITLAKRASVVMVVVFPPPLFFFFFFPFSYFFLGSSFLCSSPSFFFWHIQIKSNHRSTLIHSSWSAVS